jgi:hypothetical protein
MVSVFIRANFMKDTSQPVRPVSDVPPRKPTVGLERQGLSDRGKERCKEAVISPVIWDWVHRCLVPILVRQYLAERESGEGRAASGEVVADLTPCHPENATEHICNTPNA